MGNQRALTDLTHVSGDGAGAQGSPVLPDPPTPIWYLKGPKEQVKFPGLDVQGQPADKERPHLEKKKRGSWRPSLIPVFGITPFPPALG